MSTPHNTISFSQELERLIRHFVSLGKRSPKGYEETVCAVCNDYKPRGGFNFDPRGVIHYSCFNCGESTLYDPTRHSKIPGKFKRLLVSFGVPVSDINAIAVKAILNPELVKFIQTVNKDETPLQLWVPPETIDPPHGELYDITSDESPWCEVAREYVTNSRALSLTSWPFYVSSSKKLEGRLIIPFTYRGNLTYWQARSMDSSIQPRYLNPVVEKEKIIFNHDELYEHTKAPLFVTEGPIDAISIGPHAISMTGSTLSEWQLNEIRRVAKHRKIIFVIDKNYNGYKLGNKVLAEDWYITVMPDNVDDANKALQRFGNLWLLNHITNTAVTGFEGKLLLKLKCNSKQ